MKSTIRIWFLILSIACNVPLYAVQTTPALAQKNFNDAVDFLFSLYKKNTNSLNEKYVQDTFGPTGLNVDSKLLNYIKTLYWYLEYASKLEVSSTTKTPQKAISVSTIIASGCWQNYLKFTISQLFDGSAIPLTNARQAEQQLFKYIPDFQIAIHQTDCTGLWNMSSYIRHQLALSTILRRRMINQCTDWQKFTGPQALAACQDFKNTDYYKQSQTNPFQTVNGKLTYISKPVPSPLREQMVALSMISALQQLCSDFFNPDKLEHTMQVLSKSQISPMFLMQTADDFLLIEMLGNKEQDLKSGSTSTSAQSSAQPTAQENEDLVISSMPVDEQVVVQDFISDTFNKVKTGVTEGGEKVWKGVEKTVTSAGLAAEYGVVGITTGNTKMLGKAYDQLGQSAQGVVTMVDGLGDIAVTGIQAGLETSMVTNPVLLAFSKLDPAAAKAFESSVDSTFDAINSLRKYGETVFLELSDDVRASTEGGLNTFISAIIDHKNVGDALKSYYSGLATKVAAQMIDTLSIAWTTTKDVLGDIMKSISYISCSIVDLIIDVVHGVETVVEVFTHPGDSIPQAWQAASQSSAVQWMNDHRQAWTAGVNLGVTIGLGVALTVATGGGALLIIGGALAGGAFGLSTVVGAVQQNNATLDQKQAQHNFVNAYQDFINNSELVVTSLEQAMSNELQKKYDAQVSNMERSLGFYQNYISDTYSVTEDQLAVVLGEYQLSLLTPDTNQSVPADAGSVYGFNTQWLDLNPEQGFSLYSKARDTLSQEIAQAPEIITISDNMTPEAKFWFDQKLIRTLQQDANATLSVELIWQAIYTLDVFYLGLYLGGDALDLQSLQQTHKGDVDSAHNAKMLVYKKEHPKDPARFGIYEHESTLSQFTNGWLNKPAKAPQFNVGTWYHMKATLNNTQLQFKIWDDAGIEPADWQTVSVSSTDQRTIGFIFSGASVQFKFINPQDVIQSISSIRKQYQGQDEKNRELAVLSARQKFAKPSFGNFTLTSLGIDYLARNQYIYTTQNTNLKDSSGNALTDYVLLATWQAGTISNIGSQPQQSTNAIVSLISGNAYDSTGTTMGTYSNILSTYQSAYGTLDDSVLSTIATNKKAYAAQFLKPVACGSFTLVPTSIDDIQNGLFIYTTNTPDLKGIVDRNNTQIKDYVVAAKLNSNNIPLQTGIPFSTSTQGFVSLVTGNVYNATQPAAVANGYTRTYDSFKNQLSTTILAAITQAQSLYNAKLTQAQQQAQQTLAATQAQPKSSMVMQQDVQPNQQSFSDVKGFGGNISTLPPAQQSLSQQQQAAAGTSSTNFGFDMSGGGF